MGATALYGKFSLCQTTHCVYCKSVYDVVFVTMMAEQSALVARYGRNHGRASGKKGLR